MNYHPEDFVKLSYQIEAEGGTLLNEVCRGHEFRLKQPDPSGTLRWKRFQTTHCDQSALATVPYDPTLHIRLMDDDEPDVCIVEHPGEKSIKHGAVTVCAVDDAIGLWPRYQGVVSNRSYQNP
jgi:hypothetical protein